MARDAAPGVVTRRLLSLRTPAGRLDPHSILNELREAGELLTARDGSCVATSYSLVEQLLASREWGMLDAAWHDRHRGGSGWREHPSLVNVVDGMLGLNEPAHARHRGTSLSALARAAVQRLRPCLEDAADAFLDELSGGTPGTDIASTLAHRFPAFALCALLGLPLQDHPRLADIARTVTPSHDLAPLPSQLAAADRAMGELLTYLAEVEVPKDSLLAQLRASEPDHPDDITTLVTIILIFAGWSTSAFLLANAVSLLARHPEQARLLRQSPQLVGQAVEEMLRYEPPVLIVTRQALKDTIVQGSPIRRGQIVYLLIGSAHRDPDVFADADVFDVTRAPTRHLAFGRGTHLCIGNHLSRLEAEIIIPRLLDRFPTLTVGDVRYLPGFSFRHYSTLTLTR
ncbi:cytochrome P450 [Streptomyces sp. DK15]|uniref:cytochrome P450 n=1 Tax=Streptomyces sp. DK15 TaxID=2957499 RepID=UPI0029B40ECF|nr:cytochrome P450 [Streptomyces sp. DK15]MDX2393604.1 cytochrome P450 [Streptomyces sp. DK15]